MGTEGTTLARSQTEARILVLDDEADVALLAADALREADPAWDVVTETDPQGALERLGEEPFDCIVTDLVMPGMDGLAFAERVLSENEEVGLIALSGRGTLESSIQALRMGFADFVRKPFDQQHLQQSVCRTLRRRRRRLATEARFAELAQSNARMEASQAQLSQKLEIASHDLVLSSKRMARQLEELGRTADVARALMGIVELEDLLGLCAELIGDGVTCLTSSVALYEPHDSAVGLLVRTYPDGDGPPVLCWLRRPIQNGVLCRAAQTRKAVHIDSIGDSVLVDAQEKDLWQSGRLLAVPIPYQNVSVGVAALHRPPEDADFTTQDIRRLASLVQLMGPAILTAKVHHRQRCQIYASLEAAADGLERQVPFRIGHGARVQAYALPIAEALRLDQAHVGALQIATRLHDVGHVSIPASAIAHAGPLTDEQWQTVRRHPETGQRLLEPLDFFGEVGAIIRAHHESYDGTGYPDHKAGDEIPLVSRIIAATDAFDAMTSPRPYRTPLSVAEARGRLRDLAGQQFDPVVVEAFSGLPDETVGEIHALHR